MKHARILIVESSPFVALDLQRTLHGMGYPAPVVVPSGDEGIRLMETATFSLVLMDLDLRGAVKGKDAAKTIGRRYNTPIIFTTADAEMSMLKTKTASNSFACLLKPIRKCILRTAVEKALLPQFSEAEPAAECVMAGEVKCVECGNASLRIIAPLGAPGSADAQGKRRAPRSLESMGYALEGYWEPRRISGSADYLEPHFQVQAPRCFTRPRRLPTPRRRTRRRTSVQTIDCIGLNEICRSSDGSTYEVPRLRIKLVSEES